MHMQNGIQLAALSIPIPYLHSVQFIPTQQNALDYENPLIGGNIHRRSAAQHMCGTQRKHIHIHTNEIFITRTYEHLRLNEQYVSFFIQKKE